MHVVLHDSYIKLSNLFIFALTVFDVTKCHTLVNAIVEHIFSREVSTRKNRSPKWKIISKPPLSNPLSVV